MHSTIELRRYIAIAVSAVALTACGLIAPRTYFGEPLDPKAPNVVPATGSDATTIAFHVDPPDARSPGVEGAVLLIRLTDADGHTILDRPFAWPKDEQPVPPGAYALAAYWMGCNGNCGNLSDPAPPFCVSEITAKPNGRIDVEVSPHDLAPPGTTCIVRSDP